jgi:hypothetical protein
MSKGYAALATGFADLGSGELSSVAAIVAVPADAEASRTLVLPGTADPSVSITPVVMPFVRTTDLFRGSLLTPNTDGTITVNADVGPFVVTCMAITRYPSNVVVVLGVGVGDPSVLPSLPGTSTAALPAGTFLSRFRDIQRGEGITRQNTLQAPYFLVGKTTLIGAKAGDKIFPVMWNLEITSSTVILDDVIFAIEARSAT